MNKTLKKILSGILTAAMLMSSAVAVSAEEAAVTNPWAVEKASENTFRFGVLSDVHICPGNSNGVQQYMEMGFDAYEAMGVDAMTLLGDITNSQLAYTTDTIESNLYDSPLAVLNEYGYEIKSDDATKRANDANKKPLAYVMGNHEMAANGQNILGIQAAKSLFVEANQIDDLTTARKVGNYYTGDYVTEMGGYTFIMSSPRDGLNKNTMTTYKDPDGVEVDIEAWVMEQIEAAQAKYDAANTPNKPIFYLQHIPVNGHYGQNLDTNSDEFMTFLKNYPNVIVLSAHVHELLHDPRVISQDEGYTSAITGVMATGSANVWGATLDSTMVAGGQSGIKHSMAIDVTYNEASGTSDIKLYRLDIQNQEFIGEPFEFTIDGNAQTKYSTQARFADEGKSIAAFDEGTAVTAAAVEGTRDIKVTYDTGATSTAGTSVDVLQDNFVWGYKAFAINTDTQAAEKSTIRAAEFYTSTKRSPRTFTFSNLGRNQEYKIAVYPVTVFQQNMTYAELDAAGVVPLTTTIKTENIKSDAERALQTTRTTNVALGKSVTSIQKGKDCSILTDGKTDTGYIAEDWDGTTRGVGFIFDLEKSYKITEVKAHVYANNASGRELNKIYGSNDGQTWEELYVRDNFKDTFGTDLTLTSLSIPINNEYCRYVKVEYPTSGLATEIEIIADIPVTEISQGKDVQTSTEHMYDASLFPLKNVVDGNTGNFFATDYCTDVYHYVQLDLGAQYPIGLIETVGRPNYDGDSERSSYVAYGSNEVSDDATISDKSALDTNIYTKLTSKSTGAHLAATHTEITKDVGPYQYITIRKSANGALHLAELRAFVVNPEIADFTYNEGTVTLTFTEPMNFTNVSENITVYDSEGVAQTVTMTPSTDNTSVSFEASVGGKIVVSENITNTYGTDMQEDAEYDIYDLSIDYSAKTKKNFENVNVAYGKDIVTNDTNTGNFSPEHLVNGEAVSTYYVSATDKYYTIDLGRGYNVNKIVLSIPESNGCNNANYRYSLAGSIDGETWDTFYTAGAVKDDSIWATEKKGVHNIENDVNYRYIRYSNPLYFVLSEIEVYADVDATKVTNSSNTVTSSAVGDTYQGWNKYLVNDSKDITYVNGSGYNWISVEMDQAYPIGMYELYVRYWKADGSHQMDNWAGAHKVKLYGSNTAPTEQLDETTTNLSVADLSPYGFDVLGDTSDAWSFSTLFPSDFGKSSLMPEGWVFTDGYKETINNTKRYKNLTLKKYDKYAMEYGEFVAYVLNATVNAVDADNAGVDIHFGDKMVSDLLNTDTVTLTKDGTEIDCTGTLSENGHVYSLAADLEDGFYTLTVADDVKNVLGVPMQADFTYDFAVGDVYGIKTAEGGEVTAIAANTTYVVTEPVSGENARIAIAAIYNSDDMLVASAIENISADYAKKYAEVEITTPETLAEGAYYVKYFLWEANTFMPVLSESIKVFK